MPEELWTMVHNMVQEVGPKPFPRKMDARRQSGCLRKSDKSIAEKRREVKGKGERQRYNHLNAEF